MVRFPAMDKFASTTISRGALFGTDQQRVTVLDLAHDHLIRAAGTGDVVMVVVPQGFGQRVIDHVNNGVWEALAGPPRRERATGPGHRV